MMKYQVKKFFLFGVLAIFFIVSGCRASREAQTQERSLRNRRVAGETERLASTVLLIEATRHRMAGDFDQAVVLYYEATKRDPSNDAAHFELARIHAMKGNLTEAIAFARQAVVLDPANIFYQTTLAELFLSNNATQEAVEIYLRLVKNHPHRIDLLFHLANTHLISGQYSEAMGVFAQIEQIIGINEDISLQKQRILIETGRIDEAIAEAEKLVNAYPEEPLFLELLGDLYLETGQKEKAKVLFENLLLRDPGNPYAYLMLADYYEKTGQHTQAVEAITNAFNSARLDMESRNRILYMLFNLSDGNDAYLEPALELCRRLIELQPGEAEPYLIYGDFLFREERLEEARERFLRGVQIDPKNLGAWHQIMVINNRLEDHHSLLKHSNQALEYFLDQPFLFLFNGLANFHLEKYQDAASSLEFGLSIMQNEHELRGYFYGLLGDTYHYLGKFEKSDSAYESALKIDSLNSTVLNNYAYHLALRRERLEKAEAMALEANRIRPGMAAFQDTLGWVYFKQGRYTEAKKWIGKALLSSEEPNGVILEHFGDVLFRLNNVDEAVEYWIKAKEAGDASDLLPQKIIDRILHE
ncbi:MAG TPA: tetratricopeptide repeat protein [Bacteroidales bacterium]|nr:tetratricopeptide repeat protein [Bacteroidales bacterium]